MSLMNDALRKKNRETSGVQPSADVSMPPPAPRKTRKGLIVLVSLMLLAGAILGGICLIRSTGNASLLVKQPLTARTMQTAGTASAGSSAAVAREKAQSPPTEPIENTMPAASERLATAAAHAPPPMVPSLSSSILTSDPQCALAESGGPAEALAGAPDSKVAANVHSTPPEGSALVPAESPRQVSRTVESGPVQRVEPACSRPGVILVSEADGRFPNTNHPGEKTHATTVSDTDLFYQKALACHRSGRMNEAERFYRSVLSTDANHREATLNLAAVYIEEGLFHQAQPLLNRLEKLTPRPDGVLLNLAITALGEDTPETALNYLDRAEKAADALPWQIHFHRAVALARLNRPSEALALYQQVEAERPNDDQVQFNLAVTHDALGNYPQAIRYYQAALEGSDRASENDRQSISQRLGILRRYLNSTQSKANRQ